MFFFLSFASISPRNVQKIQALVKFDVLLIQKFECVLSTDFYKVVLGRCIYVFDTARFLIHGIVNHMGCLRYGMFYICDLEYIVFSFFPGPGRTVELYCISPSL